MTAAPDAPPPTPAGTTQEAAEAHLRFLLEVTADLPSISPVAAKVNQILSSPESSASDLARVISADPSMSANLLRVVNSPFYGLPQKVGTISQAIVILGYRALREIVMGISIMESLGGKAASPAFDPKLLWLHSLAVGSAAKQLARRLKLPGEVEIYFTAGLLHDVGKLILANCLPASRDKVARRLEAGAISFVAAERATYDTDHGFLGGFLFEKWGLENDLIRVARFHHDPLAAPAVPDVRSGILPLLIHVCDILVRLILVREITETRLPPVFPPAFQRLEALGLDLNELPRMFGEIHKEYVASKVFLGL